MKSLENFSRLLKILISISGALMLLGWLIAPSYWYKPASYLITIALPYIPDLFRHFKLEFSQPLVLTYELFLIIAMVLGIDLNWYSQVLVAADGNSYYDKIVHFASGALVAVAAQELFAHGQAKAKLSYWFQVLFLLGAVALVAVGWECYEFLYDQICGGHMQELVKAGVSDTMWDMIAALGGGIISIVGIIYCQKSNTQLRQPNSQK